MRKFLGLAAASLLAAAPALAGSMTVEFAADGQTDVFVVTLVDDGTYTASDGSAGEASEPAVGDTRAFTDTAGMTGIATITAIAE